MQTLLWPLDMCCTVRQDTLRCFSPPRKFFTELSGTLTCDWLAPNQDEWMTLICLASRTPGINTGLMRFRGMEKEYACKQYIVYNISSTLHHSMQFRGILKINTPNYHIFLSWKYGNVNYGTHFDFNAKYFQLICGLKININSELQFSEWKQGRKI